jgi:hypothetical protein
MNVEFQNIIEKFLYLCEQWSITILEQKDIQDYWIYRIWDCKLPAYGYFVDSWNVTFLLSESGYLGLYDFQNMGS